MVSSSPAWCFYVLWEVVRLCLLSGIYYEICIDLDGDFACNRVWWCHWAWYAPPIHIDPQLHRHFCRFCLSFFQVKKHLLCPVVNRCFKSMRQPFQPWMNPYDCNCWEKPLMSNSVHGYIHYYITMYVVSCRLILYHLTFPSLLLLATSRCHFHPVRSWRRAWSF